ncbi:Golgi SNAP receptor complex member 2 [Taenia crassiceps]|uniref:Golgi SNAP receptor complex member 2 n=1 Tax=Taenia crassiceps TaxID=6207 RepID=A0ABR4QN85_9CEST
MQDIASIRCSRLANLKNGLWMICVFDLSELEHLIRSLRSIDSDKNSIARKEGQIIQNLDLALSNCQRLRVLSNNEPLSKRKQVELAVNHIQSECQHLRTNLQALQRKRAAQEQELINRASLFASSVGVTAANSDATVLQIDTEVTEFSRLQAVSRRLDEMLLGGSASLEALKFQGSTLKNSHRRLLDLANTLGLSNTVMRLIQRRGYQDKVLFYVLAGGTLVAMYFIWYFIRG